MSVPGSTEADRAPISPALLPATAELVDGRCRIGGLDLEELADEFGTPLYCYDEADLRARARAYVDRMGAGNVAYASKAFLCVAMARLAHGEGCLIDVASPGELATVRAAGVPGNRIVVHGNAKTLDYLEAALAAPVHRIVVDSMDEIDLLERLSQSASIPQLLVRVAPGLTGDSHAKNTTGQEDSKFGLAMSDGAAAEAIVRIAKSDALHFAGIHAHIGSNISQSESQARAGAALARLARTTSDELGEPVREVSIGGGLGIAHSASELGRYPSIDEFCRTIRDGWADACTMAGLAPAPTLGVEPGRSIAGPASVTLYRVVSIKTVPGGRTYVAVDGGMGDNPRPALYGARYETFLPARAGEARERGVSIAGRHCEQGDVLIEDAHLPGGVAVGDVVAVPVTGAYAYSMASNYNRFPRPAVVFVAAGSARQVVRRETVDDLLRLDAD